MRLKILAAVAIVVGIASVAAAHPHYGYSPKPRVWDRPEISAEDKARFDEMRNVRCELSLELRKENPNKERARTLFAKELDLRQQLREESFRDCMENHDHSRGPCGWIARSNARVSYGNGAWVAFIREMRQEKPNKVRAWEYFSEAEKFYRAIELERFNAMLDNPKGAPCWYGGDRGHIGRVAWNRPPRFSPDCGQSHRDGWHNPCGYGHPRHYGGWDNQTE